MMMHRRGDAPIAPPRVAPGFWRGAASVREDAADAARAIGHAEGEFQNYRMAEIYRAIALRMEGGR